MSKSVAFERLQWAASARGRLDTTLHLGILLSIEVPGKQSRSDVERMFCPRCWRTWLDVWPGFLDVTTHRRGCLLSSYPDVWRLREVCTGDNGPSRTMRMATSGYISAWKDCPAFNLPERSKSKRTSFGELRISDMLRRLLTPALQRQTTRTCTSGWHISLQSDRNHATSS